MQRPTRINPEPPDGSLPTGRFCLFIQTFLLLCPVISNWLAKVPFGGTEVAEGFSLLLILLLLFCLIPVSYGFFLYFTYKIFFKNKPLLLRILFCGLCVANSIYLVNFYMSI